MKNRTIAIFVLLLGLFAPFAAQAEKPSKDYFNEGSASFIKGKREIALDKVNEGLKLYPDDYYLIALKKAIEDNKQQQQQNDQQKKDDKDQKDQQKDEQKQQQNQGNQNQQQQEQKSPPPQEKGQTKEQTEKSTAPDYKPAEEMTKDEAAMLLDAMKEEEQANREQIKVITGKPVPVEKDW